MYSGGEIKEYKQGAYTFNIRQFEPFYAMKVWGDLLKVAAPLLDGGFDAIRKSPANDKHTSDFALLANIATGGFTALARQLNGDELLRIAKLLLDPEYVYVKKGNGDFVKFTESVANEVFSGRPIDMIVLMCQVAAVNYADFTKLSSIPDGFLEIWSAIQSMFRDALKAISSQPSLSGEQSEKE